MFLVKVHTTKYLKLNHLKPVTWSVLRLVTVNGKLGRGAWRRVDESGGSSKKYDVA